MSILTLTLQPVNDKKNSHVASLLRDSERLRTIAEVTNAANIALGTWIQKTIAKAEPRDGKEDLQKEQTKALSCVGAWVENNRRGS